MSETTAVGMLSTSETFADLAAALAKAQSAFPAIQKERTARVEGKSRASGAAVEYSYAYADLSDILAAIRKPLADNGLAVIQPIVTGPDHPWLVTRLLHATGQWIESTYPLEMYERAQETGSAITYARRYALTSLLGIAAEEDDDGAAAQNATRSPRVDRPKCPKCDSTKAVIEGRDEFGGGWLCFKKKGGCGANWYDDARPRPNGDPAPEAPGDALDAPPPQPVTTANAFQCPHCGSDKVTPDGPKYMKCEACRKGYPKPAA